jgi:hypothetical protein
VFVEVGWGEDQLLEVQRIREGLPVFWDQLEVGVVVFRTSLDEDQLRFEFITHLVDLLQIDVLVVERHQGKVDAFVVLLDYASGGRGSKDLLVVY